jgi:hypothetical protein
MGISEQTGTLECFNTCEASAPSPRTIPEWVSFESPSYIHGKYNSY